MPTSTITRIVRTKVSPERIERIIANWRVRGYRINNRKDDGPKNAEGNLLDAQESRTLLLRIEKGGSGTRRREI